MPTGRSRRDGIELAAPTGAMPTGSTCRPTTPGSMPTSSASPAPALVREVRRPRHSANLIAHGEAGRFRWGASLAYVGERRDTDFDLFPAATVILDDYVLASANLGLPAAAAARALRAGGECLRRRLSGRGRLQHAGKDGPCGSSRRFWRLACSPLAAREPRPRRGGWRRSTCAPTSWCCCSPRRSRSSRSPISRSSEAETPLWRQARRYRRNDGSLLSVAPLRPDLVVTMGGGARDRLRIAERLGIATLDLPFAQSLGRRRREHPSGSRSRSAGRRAGRGAAPPDGGADAQRPARARDTIWLGGGGRTVSARRAGGAVDGAGRASAAAAAGRPGLARDLARPAARDPAAQRLSAGPIFGRAALARPSGGAARARRAHDRRPTAAAGPAWGRC